MTKREDATDETSDEDVLDFIEEQRGAEQEEQDEAQPKKKHPEMSDEKKAKLIKANEEEDEKVRLREHYFTKVQESMLETEYDDTDKLLAKFYKRTYPARLYVFLHGYSLFPFTKNLSCYELARKIGCSPQSIRIYLSDLKTLGCIGQTANGKFYTRTKFDKKISERCIKFLERKKIQGDKNGL